MAEFCLLGEVAVLLDGHALDLGPARQRCVLAALVMDAGCVVSVDRLIERVWNGRPPSTARETLAGYTSRLRRALADVDAAAIDRRSGGYVVEIEPSAVDLHRFHDLRTRARGQSDDTRAARLLTEALGLWRGQALTGVTGEWAETERDRLERERLAALQDLTDARLRLGQGGGLIPELASRAAEHPLDERVAGQYVLALHQAGHTADALDHYRRLRERLVDELGTEPGNALQDLHRRILTADPGLSRAAARADGPRVVPRQLPAAPGLFTGRVPELAALDRALATAPAGAVFEDSPGTTVVISAIGGAGGIGKTWLALACAHRWADRFPDGQLFVDLRGFSPAGQPMAPDDAVRGFLDALGVDAGRLPPDPDARAARYRSLVADRRMLIVLDNAATVEQVVPLLPGSATCTVLVTSRNRLPGLVARHGARPLHLDVLTDAESRQLVVAWLGAARVAAEEAAVTDLVGICRGFPLALGVVAARAAAGPHLPLADTVAELREFGLDALDSDDPTVSLSTVLSWSLRGLSDRQRQVFALLGIAPGPDIGLPAATNLAGLPERETRAVLRALVDASLLDRTPGGRFTMHDLVRAYAATHAQTLPEPVRLAALERVVDFYLHTAHTADRLANPHAPVIEPEPPTPGVEPHPLPDPPAAMAWLDAEHAHLIAAQRTAAAHHRLRTVWQLARALTIFHQRRGHGREYLAVWQAALEASAHLPDPATRAQAHRNLGLAYSMLEWHDEAVGHLHQALLLAEYEHDTLQQAQIHHDLAVVWEQRGDDRKAMDHARHALDRYRKLDNPVREARALNGVGWYAARLGEYDTAREHCRSALALFRYHHDSAGEAGTLDSLGWIDHHTGHHRQAGHHYQQALTLFRTLGDSYEVANTLDRLGHPYAASGQHDRARAAWREALELYREQGRDTDAERVRQQLDNPDTTAPHDTR